MSEKKYKATKVMRFLIGVLLCFPACVVLIVSTAQIINPIIVMSIAIVVMAIAGVNILLGSDW